MKKISKTRAKAEKTVTKLINHLDFLKQLMKVKVVKIPLIKVSTKKAMMAGVIIWES